MKKKQPVRNFFLLLVILFLTASDSDAKIVAKKANANGFGFTFFSSNGTCTVTTMWKKEAIHVLNGIGDVDGNLLCFGVADSTGIQTCGTGIPSGLFIGVVVTSSGTVLTYNDVSCNGQTAIDVTASQMGSNHTQAEIEAATRKLVDKLRKIGEQKRERGIRQ